MNALMRLAREMTPASATVAGLVVGELSRVAWGLAQRGGLASVHPKRPDPNRTYPRLSLIVPARNEGLTIDACLTGAAGQDYPDLEILVVDDCSQDDTAARVRAFAAVDPRVRLVSGATLPSGWAGKPWALHQGVHASTGEWLLFVDADTNLHQGAVTAVVDAARDGWIGLKDGPAEPTPVFSILTGQSLPTVWERIIQPGVLGMIMESMPVRLVNSALWPGIAIANGQFLLVRRDVYEVMGGYEAIRGEIAEDVMFARRAKGMGFRLRLADGSDLATTRMYTTPGALWEGWTKNLHVGSRLIPYLAVPGMGYLLATIIAPWVLLSTASRMGSQAWRSQLAAVMILALGLAQRAAVNRALRVPARYAITQPFGVLAFVILMIASQLKVRTGTGVTWKGRRYAG